MREDTVLSLKWHSFSTHLAGSLDTCYEKQQFVDLSLVCKDGTILKCHKMVLANSSTFFRRLLVANEHPHPMIILHDIEADDLKTIVNFMYCGEIQVVQSEVRRLLKIAEILEVTGLRHIQTNNVLGFECNDIGQEPLQKKAAPQPPRTRIDVSKVPTPRVPEHDLNTRQQCKATCQPSRPIPGPSHKAVPKPPQDSFKKSDDSPINSLSHKLETGKSGISIIDLSDMPSTSRGIHNPPPLKRKESSETTISWPKLLSAISKDRPLTLKKLCIMDEVEIIARNPVAVQEPKMQPLDRRKAVPLGIDPTVNCAVFIKDEIDIYPDVEEDADMDPLEVEDMENENSDSVSRSGPVFSFASIDKAFKSSALPDYPSRKGSNG